MPYIHTKCGGVIKWYPPLPIPPRCTKCKKVWSPWVIYNPSVPKDMMWEVSQARIIKRGATSYAKWGDKIPGVSLIASKLPNWPRWARVLTVVVVVTIITVVIWGLTRWM